jgi:hypothetical protein
MASDKEVDGIPIQSSVIGQTPPGTEVMNPAISFAS